ncbi:MAG: preprotein translocase subunit SecE [Patescibacteria group bacterium]
MNFLNSIVQYLRSSRAELQKVTWPSRKETTRYSVLVLTVSIVVAIFFATLDFGLGKVVTAAIAKRDAMKAATAEQQVPTETAPVQTTPAFDITNESPTLVPTDVQTTPVPTE